MRHIDMQTWPRRRLFTVYTTFDHPHFGMCANVDVTASYPAVKERGHSITLAIVYAITRAANAISEFRYRIRGRQVVEHEVVRPSTTILAKDDLFSFCYFEYVEDFAAFAAGAADWIAYMRMHPSIENEPGDDALYMTAIPWVSFTAFMHSANLRPADSVPRFAWGKIFHDGDLLKMPLAVQGHHALMDGQHVGMFYEKVQDYLHHPDLWLGKA
jgi:chloramphenicol O-acetyltransferase type A